jgi:hypothetical protein
VHFKILEAIFKPKQKKGEVLKKKKIFLFGKYYNFFNIFKNIKYKK